MLGSEFDQACRSNPCPYGCGSKPRVVARPPPPLCYKPLSRPAVTNPSSRISRGYDSTYYRKEALHFLGRGRPRLLQTYVAKWPSKPVTNSMFLIRCHSPGLQRLATRHPGIDLVAWELASVGVPRMHHPQHPMIPVVHPSYRTSVEPPYLATGSSCWDLENHFKRLFTPIWPPLSLQPAERSRSRRGT